MNFEVLEDELNAFDLVGYGISQSIHVLYILCTLYE